MLAGQVTESTVLLCFDSENRLLLADTVFNGNLKNYTDAHIRKILDCAISVGSSLIALGHNHPIGSLSPSENDIATTRALEFTLKNVGVSLVDGFVVNDSDWIAILDYANTLEETEL